MPSNTKAPLVTIGLSKSRKQLLKCVRAEIDVAKKRLERRRISTIRGRNSVGNIVKRSGQNTGPACTPRKEPAYPNFLGDILLGAVHHMGRPQLLRRPKLFVADVDRDDGLGPERLRQLHDAARIMII